MSPERKVLATALLFAGIAAEALLLAALLVDFRFAPEGAAWLVSHVVASVVTAAATTVLIGRWSTVAPHRVFALCLAMGVTMPLVGSAGLAAALLVGMRRSVERHRELVYWQFTDIAELPFTPPPHRPPDSLDSRGFVEQLVYGTDADDLYRKVLAAGRMPSALAVDSLNQAIVHDDDRVRLTAFQTLDRRVARLNADIQRLEASVKAEGECEQSETWLQIASNYWELLTLEQGEPVAREQLLDNAAHAARQAIVARDSNRNAHFTLGRIALRRGDPVLASIALERAQCLGMPAETVVPYLAEAAFVQRDFVRVAALLGSLDAAFKRYPPIRQLAAQWA